jgi:hypothetical protein
MKRAVGGLLAMCFVGLVMSAPAAAVDPREPLPTPDPVLLPAFNSLTGEGYCTGFTAVVTYTQFNQYIVRQTTAADGTLTLKIAGVAKAAVTNQTTLESVSYNISGPGTIVINPDGSFSIDAAGPNLLWTEQRNLANFAEVPAISYTTGHVTLSVDASGQTTAYNLAGGARQTDVCAVLAS